jgi:WD40 repeat protein
MKPEHLGKVRDMKFNPDTKELVTLGSDAMVKLWDTSTMRVVRGDSFS